jgi:hypothetical protein
MTLNGNLPLFLSSELFLPAIVRSFLMALVLTILLQAKANAPSAREPTAKHCQAYFIYLY